MPFQEGQYVAPAAVSLGEKDGVEMKNIKNMCGFVLTILIMGMKLVICKQ